MKCRAFTITPFIASSSPLLLSSSISRSSLFTMWLPESNYDDEDHSAIDATGTYQNDLMLLQPQEHGHQEQTTSYNRHDNDHNDSTLQKMEEKPQKVIHPYITHSTNEYESLLNTKPSHTNQTSIRVLKWVSLSEANRVMAELMEYDRDNHMHTNNSGGSIRDKTNHNSNTAQGGRALLCFEGYVVGHRQLGKSLAFVELGCREEEHDKSYHREERDCARYPVTVMLKRSNCNGEIRLDPCEESTHMSFQTLLRVMKMDGIRLRVLGKVGISLHSQTILLLVHDVQVVGLPRNRQHLQVLLQLVVDNQMEWNENLQRETNLSKADLSDENWIQLVSSPKERRALLTSATGTKKSTAVVNNLTTITGRTVPRACTGDEVEGVTKLSRLILSRLPSYEDYPYEILRLDRRRRLPMAPVGIQIPPTIVVNQRMATGTINGSLGKHGRTTKESLSVSTQLEQRVLQTRKSKEYQSTPFLIEMMGYVQNRQRYQNNITVFSVIEDSFSVSSPSPATDDTAAPKISIGKPLMGNGQSETKATCLKCILHPDMDIFQNFPIYMDVLAPGTKIQLQGILHFNNITPTHLREHIPKSCSADSFVCWVTHLVGIRQCSWYPRTVRLIVQRAATLFPTLAEGAQALAITEREYESYLSLLSANTTTVNWIATEISQRLQFKHSRRVDDVTKSEQETLLDRYRCLRDEVFPIIPTPPWSTNLNHSGLISPIILQKLSRERRWDEKKLPQLVWMLEQIQKLCRSHPQYGMRPLRILDVGGGKGLLANVLATSSFLGEAAIRVDVLDVNPRAIRKGQMLSHQMGIPPHVVRYHVGDASVIAHEENGVDHEAIDLVVALHACGTLTDIALYRALYHNAAFVICPCCFQSNKHLSIRHGVEDDGKYTLKSGNVTTTSTILPLTLSVEDWLGISLREYDLLCLLAERQGEPLARTAMHTIAALRTRAFLHHHSSSRRMVVSSSTSSWVQIRSFPIQYSTRNLVLVGGTQGISGSAVPLPSTEN